MALIIEDGSIVANANSFATVVECQAFADARGLTLPSTDAEIEILLINASDFLFSLENDFQAFRTSPSSQVLPFPRETVYLYGESIASDAIPQILKDGQCRLAFDASQQDLLATGSGRVVKKEGVGPLVVEYGDDGASNPQANLTAALTILAPLFKESSTAASGSFTFCVNR
jgi:hypothetical protein